MRLKIWSRENELPRKTREFVVFIGMNDAALKFLHTVLKDKFESVINGYRDMRIMFQNAGVKNSQLEKGTELTIDMYRQREFLTKEIADIKKTLMKYGLISNEQEFFDYITQILSSIDIEISLND